MTIEAKVQTITPKMATHWLENTTLQRPISQKHVEWLAAQMKAGTFAVNGESIVLNGDKVLDGQHRLWACVEANVPFKSLVVEGVDEDSFATIDTGRTRSGGDIVAIVSGDRNMATATRSAASAAIKVCMSVDGTGRLNTARYREINNTHVAEFLGKHPVFVVLTEKIRSLFKRNHGFTVSHFVALTFLVSKGFPDVLETFVEPCVSGADLVRDSAAYALREKCLADPKPSDFRAMFDRLGVLFKAWNAHVQGVPVKTLRLSRGVEAYPTLITHPGQRVQNRKRA